MIKKKIPIYQPYLNGNEKKYVNECLDDTWISSKGKYIDKFEKEFSKYLNIKYSTAVSNGTVALHLALYALDISSGDEVIVPTLTYVASINAIKYVGARPIFIDANPKTLNIDTKLIKSKITSKTKAIIAVHLYGLPCNMNELVSICNEYNLYLIEDAAEAFGSKYNNKAIGTFGDISTFSFFGNKTITTGEGGMVVSHNKKLIDKVKSLKSQSVSKTQEYWHSELGFNYRMTNICSAIGLAQLEQADIIINKKIQIARFYKKELSRLPLQFQHESNFDLNTYWMVTILLDNVEDRDLLREYLSNNNIETRPIFYPSHLLPMYLCEEDYPNAEEISLKGINLPSYPSLLEKDIVYICNIIKKYFKKYE